MTSLIESKRRNVTLGKRQRNRAIPLRVLGETVEHQQRSARMCSRDL
jgi:hypothetical protein